MRSFREIAESQISEGVLAKFNNWFKNIDLVKMVREEKLQNEYNHTVKLFPISITFSREENGYDFYIIESNKEDSLLKGLDNKHLCFLSSSDKSIMANFQKQIDEKMEGSFWFTLGEIKSMTQNKITPYFIQEMSIDKSK
jgi:hypothetical protein